MRDKTDPEHIINKKNIYGFNGLYIASMNGNLAVIMIFFLIHEYGRCNLGGAISDRKLGRPQHFIQGIFFLLILAFY